MSKTDNQLAQINTKYGDRLTPQELEEISEALEVLREASTQLHSIKLENADEPYPPFKPRGEPS